MSKELRQRALEVADSLTGTCKALTDFATDDEQNNLTFCAILDEQVTLCEVCGWWCETDDCEDGVCNQCKDD